MLLVELFIALGRVLASRVEVLPFGDNGSNLSSLLDNERILVNWVNSEKVSESVHLERFVEKD